MLSTTILLGAVQGLTEFLPISSSGHLVAVRVLFDIPDVQGTAFDAFLHLGTLLAVLVYYRQVWWDITRSIFKKGEDSGEKRELAAKLAIATVPAAIAGYAFQGVVGQFFRTADAVAGGLLITAAVLAVSDWLAQRAAKRDRASYRDAAYIGLAQVFALVPGISRSGMTIATGHGRGLSRQQATHFSFLMSAPIIAGAGLASLEHLLDATSYPSLELLSGFLTSFVFGLLAISVLLRVVEKISFLPFAIYLVFVAILLTVIE